MTFFYFTWRFVAACLAVFLGVFNNNFNADVVSTQVRQTLSTTTTSQPLEITVESPTVRPTTVRITSITTTTLALPDGKCSEWFPLATEAGWPADRLVTLGNIMWAESRCDPTVWGTGAFGLTQIQYNAHAYWLKTQLHITERDDLYDPRINLQAALWLATYAETNYGCWAQPWYMSGDWC